MKKWIKRLASVFIVLSTIVSIIGGAFVAGFATGVFSGSDTGTLGKEIISGEDVTEKIGILRLEGLVLSSGSQGPFGATTAINSKQVKSWLKEIEADSQVKALILEVNSPGGSPVASDEIYQALQSFRQSGRKVVVVMEDTAASGAYFFSVAADTIIASPATLTGSIGVIAEIPNLEELLARAGINIEVYKSGEYKDLTSFSRSRSPEEKALIQEYIDAAFNLFIDRVVEGRNMERSQVLPLAKGQAFSGVKAQEVGLVDQLGSLDDAIVEAKTLASLDEAQIIRYRTESALDVLFGRVGSQINPLGKIVSQLTTPGLRAFYLPSF